jgi:predicted DsbA family dithiol-disulfide isomerase
MSEREPIQFDLISDFACPWCRIGKHQIDVAMGEFPDETISLRFHPYMLRPDMPLDGEDFRSTLSAKFGEDNLASMFERVTEAGANAGIEFNFDKIQRSPSTITSHRLMAMVDEAKQSDLATRIFDAYFRDGRDIGDINTLVAIASEAGLDGESFRTRLQSDELFQETTDSALAAAAAGIGGVPFAVVDQQYSVSGAQPVEVFASAIEHARNAEVAAVS